jgi:hypothetical protein
VLIHRVQTAPCQHSEPLVWEAERLYRLRNTLVCLAIGGDGDAWQRLLDMSARAHTRLLRRMEAATAASKTRMAELNAQLGIQWLAARAMETPASRARRRGCTSKRRYRTRRVAWMAARRATERTGRVHRAYGCDFCTGFHITSKPKRW